MGRIGRTGAGCSGDVSHMVYAVYLRYCAYDGKRVGVCGCWYGKVPHLALPGTPPPCKAGRRAPSKRPTSPAVDALALARAAPLGAARTGPRPPRPETVSSALARPPPAARAVSSPRLIFPNTPDCSQRPAASLPAVHRPRAQAHRARSRLTLARARSSRLSPSHALAHPPTARPPASL